MAKKKKAELAVVDGQSPEEQYTDLRREVLELRATVETGYWDLAIKMSEVYDNSAYLTWGYETWEEYVDGALEFQPRKARYLVSIAKWFGALNKPVQKWVAKLGWTKAKELVNRVTNENAAEWKKKLEGKSYRQLLEMLSEQKAAIGAGSGGSGDGEGGGDGDGLAGTVRPSTFKASLFPEQMDVVEGAIAKAQEVSQSEKVGHNLSMICVEYLANNAAISDAESYLAHVEKLLGVKLVAYRESTETIVYGDALLERVAASVAEDS